MPALTPKMDRLMKEYRNALSDGIGDAEDKYTLICIAQLNEIVDVGVAYSVAERTVYAIVDNTTQSHNPDWMPGFLLDTAKGLTEFFQTLIVPAQHSHGRTCWGGKQRGPFIAYKFSLLDNPLQLRH